MDQMKKNEETETANTVRRQAAEQNGELHKKGQKVCVNNTLRYYRVDATCLSAPRHRRAPFKKTDEERLDV